MLYARYKRQVMPSQRKVKGLKFERKLKDWFVVGSGKPHKHKNRTYEIQSDDDHYMAMKFNEILSTSFCIYDRKACVLLLAMLHLMAFGPNHFMVNALSATSTTRTNNPTHNIHGVEGHRQSQPNDKIEGTNPPITIPWLIVGGGIHGVHIATRLLGSPGATSTSLSNINGITENNMCIVDNNEHLLHKWKSRTSATGMEYLRSSAGYHLDLEENSLRRQFGIKPKNGPGSGGQKKKKKTPASASASSEFFTADYERPRLDVFNQHCDSIINKYKLDKMHTHGAVTSIEPTDSHVRVGVSLPNGKTVVYEAGNVVLALGNDEPAYADWVKEEDIEQGLVRHLLDDDNNERRSKSHASSMNQDCRHGRSIAVIGGGITAAHKALELARQSKDGNSSPVVDHHVHLISRHSLKEQQFDTHQDWMMDRAASKRSEEAGGSGMPKRQQMFANNSSWEERRKIIAQERLPGTVTPAVNRGKDGLCYAIENGNIHWHQAEVLEKRNVHDAKYHAADSDLDSDEEKEGDAHKMMELTLSCGEKIKVDEILLATGFGKKLPGGIMIQRDLIEKAGLEVSDFCGFPIVNEHLQWHPRIYTAGALAELELGPSARNIAGARLAAERILQSIKQ